MCAQLETLPNNSVQKSINKNIVEQNLAEYLML